MKYDRNWVQFRLQHTQQQTVSTWLNLQKFEIKEWNDQHLFNIHTFIYSKGKNKNRNPTSGLKPNLPKKIQNMFLETKGHWRFEQQLLPILNLRNLATLETLNADILKQRIFIKKQIMPCRMVLTEFYTFHPKACKLFKTETRQKRHTNCNHWDSPWSSTKSVIFFSL